MMASPTPISAAASTMTNSANTWPLRGTAAWTVVSAVTSTRLTALSISSTAISSSTALRRTSTP